VTVPNAIIATVIMVASPTARLKFEDIVEPSFSTKQERQAEVGDRLASKLAAPQAPLSVAPIARNAGLAASEDRLQAELRLEGTPALTRAEPSVSNHPCAS